MTLSIYTGHGSRYRARSSSCSWWLGIHLWHCRVSVLETTSTGGLAAGVVASCSRESRPQPSAAFPATSVAPCLLARCIHNSALRASSHSHCHIHISILRYYLYLYSGLVPWCFVYLQRFYFPRPIILYTYIVSLSRLCSTCLQSGSAKRRYPRFLPIQFCLVALQAFSRPCSLTPPLA